MKVKIFLLFLFALPTTFVLGVKYGYSTGIENQFYFDAPAKIFLYDTVIERSKSNEYLEGEIVKQARILMENRRFTNKYLLNLPPHNMGMRENFEFYSSKLGDIERLEESINLICTYNDALKATKECRN